MRISRRLALVALVSAGALLLSGCVPTNPDIVPPPESSSSSIFASDEEALAAATEAYEAYLAMSDLIAQEGGKNPERLAPFVTEEWLANELDASNSIAAAGRHLEGDTGFDTVTLQRVDQEPNGSVIVVVYVCVDLTHARLLEANGQDVAAIENAARWPFEVTFEGGSGKPLAVGGHEEWPLSEYC